MPRIHVAVGVIRNKAGEILISKRHLGSHQGGLWEFPGGKVEAGETVVEALQRELLEELGIRFAGAQPLLAIEHDYSDKAVCLDVWLVDVFEGSAEGREGQPLAWVTPSRLHTYPFPAANQPIIAACQALQLPRSGAS
jgi:8-oxo-dGTP diphosphatase